MPYFRHAGQRLAYTEHRDSRSGAARAAAAPNVKAASGRPIILLHGLLLSQDMHAPLARDLAAKGNRVITLDLLGHGRSDRPRDMWRYSMKAYGDQVVALMDHLGIEQAVVMGTSLGANVALETAAAHPDRVRGLVIEMPVLDNGLLASAVVFTPLLVALTFGEPLMQALARVTRAIPRRLVPHYGNVALDTVRQDPGPSGALMQGLFFGRIAPPRSERSTLTAPALVLGHTRDPVHPFSDAGMLAREMPNARLITADSLVELRLRPERLTNEIASFLDEVWAPRPRRRRSSRSATAAGGASGAAGTVPVRSRVRARAASTSRRTQPG